VHKSIQVCFLCSTVYKVKCAMRALVTWKTADSKASSERLLTPEAKCSARTLAQSVRPRPVSAAIDRASQLYSPSHTLEEVKKYVGPVSTYSAAVCLELRNPNVPELCIWLVERKIAVSVSPAPRNFHTNFGVSAPVVFKLWARTWTDRQDLHCGLLGRMHNNNKIVKPCSRLSTAHR